MNMGNCDGCLYQEWDGELGTIQSCGRKEDVTFTEDEKGIEIDDVFYSWGKCPLWVEMLTEPIADVNF